MHLTLRNVNTCFWYLVSEINSGSIRTVRLNSRNGGVIRVREPVLITYKSPKERVLFNAARDANPVFHVMEALWMLAGRNDVAKMSYYASKYGEITSDDGVTANGAYGYRWRKAKPLNRRGMTNEEADERAWNRTDQLEIIIDHFKRIPDSRRAVLQMWNVEDDLLKIGSDLDFMRGKVSKDVCCNLSVLFELREASVPEIESHAHNGYLLDMTVTNRSNDLVLGMLGANVVHFSFLQEYMAAHIGVGVGEYHHFTNNLHVYVKDWKPDKLLKHHVDCYQDIAYQVNTTPLVLDPARFDVELPRFVEKVVGVANEDDFGLWTEPFLVNVALPMHLAFNAHKRRDYDRAGFWAGEIQSWDWRLAMLEWIERRKLSYENRSKVDNPYLKNELERMDAE